MAYSSPAAIVTGTVISKTTFGDVVKADLDYLANSPSCRVFTTSTAAFVTATWGAIPFDSESWDTASMHSNSTNNTRVTAPDAGLYVVEGVVCFAAHATGLRLAGLRVNGSGATGPAWGTNYTNALPTPFPSHVPISAIIKLAVGDYVELVGWQSSGGNLNLFNENGDNHLAVKWVGQG